MVQFERSRSRVCQASGHSHCEVRPCRVSATSRWTPSDASSSFLASSLYAGPAGLAKSPQMVQGLRCCHLSIRSSSRPSFRKAHQQVAPLRALNVRADASVNAVAVDQPPTARKKSKSASMVPDGQLFAIDCEAMLPSLHTDLLYRFWQNRPFSDKSSDGER